MESSAQIPSDAALMLDAASQRPHTPTPAPSSRRRKVVRLLVRDNLDGRTKARKQFDVIARGIAADLGGAEHLTTVQCQLVEAFAGCALIINAINTKLLSGDGVDITEHSYAASTLVRLASRIGLGRRARDVNDLTDHIAKIETRAATAEATS
jgi:hypothetical protein